MKSTSCLLSGALLLLLASTSFGQGLDSKGDDFIVAWLPATADGYTPAIELHLTSDVATDVTVDYPANVPTFTTTVNVTPGNITIVSLPSTLSSGPANGWTADTVSDNCARVTADDEFVAYMINRVSFTSDAALCLPVDTMNTKYLLFDYDPVGLRSEFVVYAGFDATTVTITPSVDLVGGHAAGVPFDVLLDAGEGYLGIAANTSGPAGSITGTCVSSDNPVGVTNGSECVNVPSTTAYCDHIFEVAQPVQTWGMGAFVANLPNRPGGTIYRILASEDDTQVTQDGAPLATLDAGDYFETPPLTGHYQFLADKPIYVCQYMTGSQSPGATLGDPAMGNMIPFEQYQTAYTFSTVGGSQFVEHYLTVIADLADVQAGTILLDGVPIPDTEFTPFALAPTVLFAIVPLSDGTHTTQSTTNHGITVEGYNTDDSYLYPGGARFNFINPVGDENAPLCQVDVDELQGTASGTATDDRPSEDTNMNGILDPGEDLNNNGLIDEDTGIFFVALAPGSFNLNLTVSPFVPGDGSVSFTVDLIDPSQTGYGGVDVTDGAGNLTTCPIEFCMALASATPVNDAGGFNAQNSLDVLNPGETPYLGNPSFSVLVDDAADACSITPGSLVLVVMGFAPGSLIVDGLGCGPATPGDVLLSFGAQQIFLQPTLIWSGPGTSSAVFSMPIPLRTDICGAAAYLQAAWIDLAGPAGPAVLTNRLDLVFGH